MQQSKIDFKQLGEGYKFDPIAFQLDSSQVKAFIEAVDEPRALYADSGMVPPMAVVALTLAALSERIIFPSGAIHVSQEVEFLKSACVNDTIVSQATVLRRQKRGPINMLSIGISAGSNRSGEIMTGKTEFILPAEEI